jgi:hypothetical protein
LAPGYETDLFAFYELCLKFHTFVCTYNYIHARYETTYPSMKLHTQVWNCIPRYGTAYLGMELHTQVRNYIPRYETAYLGMKLHTRAQTLLLQTELRYVLSSWVINLILCFLRTYMSEPRSRNSFQTHSVFFS